ARNVALVCMAARLRSVQRQPVPTRTSEAVHRQPTSPSSNAFVRAGVSGDVAGRKHQGQNNRLIVPPLKRGSGNKLGTITQRFRAGLISFALRAGASQRRKITSLLFPMLADTHSLGVALGLSS